MLSKQTTDSETSTQILMLGYLCSKDLGSLPEKVSVLDRFGLSGTDIALICGCAVQSVKDARQKLKRKAK